MVLSNYFYAKIRFNVDSIQKIVSHHRPPSTTIAHRRPTRLTPTSQLDPQDRFARLTRAYFRRARAAAVVCDVTREGTLEAVVQWKRELDSWASSESEGQSTLPVVLFANKSDLLTNAKESFVLGARMEQLCRKVRWKYCGCARGGSHH